MAKLKDGTTIDGIRAFGLPIGTVLMYDGTSWTDNSTIPGWYACIAANAGVGAPDMVNRFVIGCNKNLQVAYWNSSSKTFVGTTSVRYGGAATLSLTPEYLPTHTHNLDHTHTLAVLSQSTEEHYHTWGDYAVDSLSWGATVSICYGKSIFPPERSTLDTTTDNTGHYHDASFPIDAYTGLGNSAVNKLIFDSIWPYTEQSSTVIPIDITPANYTLLFIRRCS